MSLVLLREALLWDGMGAAPLEGAQVPVEDGRIKEVADGPITAADARTIDLGGRFLMPGLIDAHFHAVAADPDISELEAMPPSMLYQHARLTLEGALRRGFTTVRDAGGADYGLARAVESGLIAGPRIFYSGRALSQTGGHGDFRPFEQPCLCGQGAQLNSGTQYFFWKLSLQITEGPRRGEKSIVSPNYYDCVPELL